MRAGGGLSSADFSPAGKSVTNSFRSLLTVFRSARYGTKRRRSAREREAANAVQVGDRPLGSAVRGPSAQSERGLSQFSLPREREW